MLRFNPKGIVTVLGCSSAIALASATTLPRTATTVGDGGYLAYGCATTADVACSTLKSGCGGYDVRCLYPINYSSTDVCGGSAGTCTGGGCQAVTGQTSCGPVGTADPAAH